MIAIGHTSIGAVIGMAVASATPGLPLSARLLIVALTAIISHYICDWIPHGHYHVRWHQMSLKTFVLALIDLGLFSSVLLYLAWLHFGLGATFLIVMLGMTAAMLPDFFEGSVRIGLIPQWRWVRAHHYFHIKKMHWHSKPLSQIIRLPRPIQMTDMWLLGLFAVAVQIVS